jgi:hypothetical protein
MTKFKASVAALALIASFATFTAPASALEQMPQKYITALRNNCVADYMSHCMGINPNGGAAFQCLRKNVNTLSSGCQEAVRAVPPPKS